MTKPLLETVKNIIYLLSLNGNTKEYQYRKKQLSNEEQLVLNKLKQQKARNIHNTVKQCRQRQLDMISLDGSTTSDSSRPRTLIQYYNISEDNNNAIAIEMNIDDPIDDVVNVEKHDEIINDINISLEETLEIENESNNTEPTKKKKLNKSQRKQRRLNQQNLE